MPVARNRISVPATLSNLGISVPGNLGASHYVYLLFSALAFP